jgi:hypothetical protein
MKKKGSSCSSNSGGMECDWYRKYSLGTASSHIWTQFKELKARRDRNGAETVLLSRKSLTLKGPTLLNGSSTPAYLLT